MSDPEFVYVIYIRATPQQVWDALTDGESTKAFWFGGWFDTDWRVGSPLACRRNGKVDFTGEVLESDPPKRLVFTFVDAGDLKGEGVTRVTYEIEAVEHATRLRMIHDQFPADSRLRRGVAQGWPVILSGLKSLLETGRVFETDMVEEASSGA